MMAFNISKRIDQVENLFCIQPASSNSQYEAIRMAIGGVGSGRKQGAENRNWVLSS